jgi:tRNA threonylcarbamoyladenosine biosynthesis protein TsaB
MIIVAIETSTEACSAAISLDGDIIERYRVAPREHAALILPMIEDLLAEAGLGRSQLDAVAFGRGPGSFTGLRIAAGVTQGIAFALDLPVTPVSTLAALAADAFEGSPIGAVYACLDARMGEIYGAAYRRGPDGFPILVGDEAVLPPQEADSAPVEVDVGLGSGWTTYRDILLTQLGPAVSILDDRFPRARHIARLGTIDLVAGRAVAAADAVPVYLRDRVARKPPS